MFYQLKELNANNIYQLMAQTVIPRPIAWIVTQDEDVINIAPFSFFTPLSSNPPTVVVSIGHKSDGSQKDTYSNILKNKKCTICMVDEYNLEKMHFSSKELPKKISEAQEFDIETKSIFESYPPAILNCTVAYACSFNQIIDLNSQATIPVVLNVENIYVNDDNFTDELKRDIKFNPVARVSREYAFLGQRIKAPTID